MRVRLVTLVALLSTACTVSPPGAPAYAPAPSVSVPAACAGVWQHVFTGFDPSWTVTVRPPSTDEQALPLPDVRDAFLATVAGLDDAVAHMDALDKDVFYLRLRTGTLTTLTAQYSAIDPALIERAKIEACRNRVADRDGRLATARTLLWEVERSPSANLPELRAKLRQARDEADAVVKEQPDHPEGRELIARIDELLTQLAPRAHPEDPTEAEATAALDALEALVKGGGARGEIEALHTRVRRTIVRLKRENGPVAAPYESRAQSLWDAYASRLTRIDDVCVGCPSLNLAALARRFDTPRLLGAGDYTLADVEAMAEDVNTQKPRYTTLLTGDFNRDGSMDVALVGRGRHGGKDRLFLLIAARENDRYRPLFLQLLDWDKAALAAKDGTVVLSMLFGPTDDFWWVRWNGKRYVLRYAGKE